jgi:hypothetical protein
VAAERGLSGTALMEQTNEAGKAHRDAIKECGG